jgi:hypothetical protein
MQPAFGGFRRALGLRSPAMIGRLLYRLLLYVAGALFFVLFFVLVFYVLLAPLALPP